MKLIELIDDNNFRCVDLIDNIYDFGVGMDLTKVEIKNNYDIFHKYFVENVEVIEDLKDRVIIDVSSFVNKNKKILEEVFPNYDLESLVDCIYEMEVGNYPDSIYDKFVENLNKNIKNDLER